MVKLVGKLIVEISGLEKREIGGSIYGAEDYLEHPLYAIQPFWNLGYKVPNMPETSMKELSEIAREWDSEAKVGLGMKEVKNTVI